MVVGAIAQGIYTAGKIIFRYRKQIYSIVTAQDRYIKNAFVGTRVSKAAQYGWRSGAAAGGIVGSFISNNADDTPGNGLQTQKPKYTPSPSYQTRNRFTTRSYTEYASKRRTYQERRCPSPRKSYRM